MEPKLEDTEAIQNQEEVYNEEKYSESLSPRSDFEKILWAEIDHAEEPIRNILKRINRLSIEKFPQAKFITEQSCTGHVNEKGELEKDVFPAALFVENIEGEEPTEDAFRYLNPGITFNIGQNNAEIENLDDTGIKNFLGFFKKLFDETIKSINEIYGKEVLNLYYTKDESVIFEFHVQDKERAYQILKDFWTGLENKLGEFDGIKYKTHFEKTKFLRDSFNKEDQ